MSELFEGDLIRPLGLVTLYFAYAEYELELLLGDLSALEPIDETQRPWNVGGKLRQAQEMVRRLADARLSDLEQALADARLLFERRNELVHNCILAGGRVLPTRPGVRVSRTSVSELNSLAESIFNCKERISASRQRSVALLIAARVNGA